MKVWIIYDSKFGNNKKVAEEIGKKLAPNHEVHIQYAKKSNPLQVVKDKPDVLLFGGPRRIGRISFTLRKWVEKFAKLSVSLHLQLKKLGAWETRGEMKKEEIDPNSKMELKIYEANLHLGDKWKELIQKVPTETPAPELLSLLILGMKDEDMGKGTLEPTAMDKVNAFIDKIF